jgi:hypothetical protein
LSIFHVELLVDWLIRVNDSIDIVKAEGSAARHNGPISLNLGWGSAWASIDSRSICCIGKIRAGLNLNRKHLILISREFAEYLRFEANFRT